jgi:hypothetical protein
LHIIDLMPLVVGDIPLRLIVQPLLFLLLLLPLQVCQLSRHLPYGVQSRWWRRVFSTAHDGADMMTMMRRLGEGGRRAGGRRVGGQSNGYRMMDLVVLVQVHCTLHTHYMVTLSPPPLPPPLPPQDMQGFVFGGMLAQFDTEALPNRK